MTTDASHPTDPWIPDEDTLAAVDRWLAYRVWHSRVPGAQVAVGVAGRVLLSRAYGFAELETRTPLTPQHLFRIASHSKTFTSTVVLKLVEQGRLGLEDAVAAHVPELADDYGAITVRELLEHTGGLLRDGRDADYWQAARAFPDRAELLELVRGGRKREPGELFAYSNLGFSVLGLVIEDVTGGSFFDACREFVTGPLGLDDTAAEYLPERAGDYAAGYTGLTVGTTRERLDHVDTRAMAAATGFTSTATDLVRYFAAHRMGDERLLTDRSKRLQQRKLNSGDPEKPDGPGYGLGMVHERVHDHLLVGHSGGYPGHITKTYCDPVTGLVVSVLTNATDGPATALATGVVRLLDRARQEREDHADRAVSPEALGRTGRYASRWGVLDLAALGGSLTAIFPAGWDPIEGSDRLMEESADRWLIAEGDGYGSVGEPVTFSADGLRYGGMSMARFDELPERGDVLA
ncbi:CubicO group peptidase (beta-lactamase class C family) [Friedmanniella endophytica]|uniref:CubicO group peptidase (Beta-lactamase class C family) n=1 Tax=Microlunatus kandeliicorticis TaxID=1759536 RepID=A0A7W3IS32_9ACTN|nr:serine hydrolase domain-containing protein [Microlunatus kandeliicorticis]MBA8794195.1 CubicO group peptidase (beta-lactamase class C family) [Microlunatus kandeliicorticis]